MREVLADAGAGVPGLGRRGVHPGGPGLVLQVLANPPAGGQHGVGIHARAQLEAVHSRHHQVEQHQAGIARVALQPGQRLGAIGGLHDGMTMGSEDGLDAVAEIGVVADAA